jgi:hypothetical protein
MFNGNFVTFFVTLQVCSPNVYLCKAIVPIFLSFFYHYKENFAIFEFPYLQIPLLSIGNE